MQGMLRSLCVMTMSLAAAVGLGACDKTPASKKPNMTALSSRLQPLFDKTKIICFGRFVMDVLATATVVFGPTNVPLKIDRLPGEADKLTAWVERRESELKSEDRYPTGSGTTLYKETLDGALPEQKIVMGWEDFDSSFYKIESFIKLGPDLFIQEDRAFPKKKPQQTQLSSPDESISLLNKMAHQLRARPDDEIPADPGVCIDGAFISGLLDQDFENIALGVRLKEFPDVHFVHFSIETKKTQFAPTESDALEPRLKDAERDAHQSGHGAWYSRIKFLRRGDRELNGWKGFEVLARKPAQDGGHENHEFLYLSPGEVKNAFKPHLDLQLNTGVDDNKAGAVSPSLDDEEAVALWDKLTSSIRVRPTGAGVKTSAAPPPKIPLGELAATGRICPQSGWWDCAERAAPVRGGRRQFFRAGDPMPDAVLLGKPGLLQRIKGDAPTYRTATVWKLVGYESTSPAPPVSHEDLE